MRCTSERYIPALSFEKVTPCYDLVLCWTMREAMFKPRLVEQAHIQPGHHVLDLGCGAATLTVLVKQRRPRATVVGLDGDAAILALARAKVARVGVKISFAQGMAFQLPYLEHTFDRVLTSLLLHHLTSEHKRRTLKETFRVLRPGGELHVTDFGKPHNAVMLAVSVIVRWLEEAHENVKGMLPGLIREAGFERVEETARYTTAFGTLSCYRGVKPGSGSEETEGNSVEEEGGDGAEDDAHTRAGGRNVRHEWVPVDDEADGLDRAGRHEWQREPP